jgi:hypothetical protein
VIAPLIGTDVTEFPFGQIETGRAEADLAFYIEKALHKNPDFFLRRPQYVIGHTRRRLLAYTGKLGKLNDKVSYGEGIA